MKTLILMLCACALSAVAETGAAVNAKPIKMDSLMGYTLGKKYSFDGFDKTTVADDGECHYSKSDSPNEGLTIYTTLDSMVVGITHWLLLAENDVAGNLAAVQRLVADMESEYGIKFKFEQEKDSDSLKWSCGDGTKRILVSFVRGNFVEVKVLSGKRGKTRLPIPSTYIKDRG